jgi:hypothetical protein
VVNLEFPVHLQKIPCSEGIRVAPGLPLQCSVMQPGGERVERRLAAILAAGVAGYARLISE